MKWTVEIQLRLLGREDDLRTADDATATVTLAYEFGETTTATALHEVARLVEQLALVEQPTEKGGRTT